MNIRQISLFVSFERDSLNEQPWREKERRREIVGFKSLELCSQVTMIGHATLSTAFASNAANNVLVYS